MKKDDKDTFTGLFDAMQDSIGERLSSPLIFSFSVSWLIINYRFILMMFSEESIIIKVQMLNIYTHEYGIPYLVLYPFAAMCFYVFLYPFIARPVNRFVQRKRIEIQVDNEMLAGQQIVTEERLKGIQARFYDEKQELTEENQRLSAALGEVQAKLDVLTSAQNKTLSPEPKNEQPALDIDSASILLFLGDMENDGVDRLPFSNIYASSELPKVRAKLALERLIQGGYASTYSSGTTKYAQLTNKGRAAYVASPSENHTEKV